MISTRTLVLSFLFHSLSALAQEEAVSDPKNARNRKSLKYIPNKPLAIISGLLYLAIPAICLIWARKHWARYMLTIMIGGVCYAIGLFMRLREFCRTFGSNPDRLSLYIIMNMFTVLSPCAFIATVYMLLGRLALHLDADEYLLVKARIITKLFLAAGGGMAAMQSLKDVGKKAYDRSAPSSGQLKIPKALMVTWPLPRVFVVTWPPLYLTRYGHVDSIDTAVEMGVSRDMEK
ncbi:RTA1 domain-containing protein [Rhizoctonia solani AG-1 IA]|uniref:RTA1 domain-containing protein n=1 Tax=Thanatephorus cucumeris (strain AG1-IA) TaxID=983506 RepID=L8WWG3_THACA|nr:RTA1 domain-containing protein [Rhizoctonia solani AG-1 IA]